MKDLILKDVLEYYSKKDISQIDHTIKVAYFTKTIAKLENYSIKDIEFLEIVALLHDIGCPLSKEKYGNTIPKNQEKEGMCVAKEILSQEKYIEISEEIKEKITKIVGSHHQKAKAIEFNFAPLFDADTIINTLESYHKDSLISRKLLITDSGKDIFNKIYK